MNKKTIITCVSLIVIGSVIYSLVGTFASDSTVSIEDTYNFTITGSTGEITVPAGTSKTVLFQITNTNKGVVKYGVAYSGTDITVKYYNDTIDPVTGMLDYGESKFIKLYIKNSGNVDSVATIKEVLGYENGGELTPVVQEGYTLVTEMTTGDDGVSGQLLSQYIENLYNSKIKTIVTNNDIKYYYAEDVSLMNDRLGGTTSNYNDGNIRYYGANPNNYIYFNCSDYDNLTSETCEKWRIIGLFKDVEMSDGTKRDLVKIRREENIGSYSWDQSSEDVNGGDGINEWNQADLMKLLNPTYENETIGGSLYWNSGSGSCYGYDSNLKEYTSIPCDFTGSGLSSGAQNKIATVKWNLGGHNNSNIYANQIYGYERETNVVVPGVTCSGSSCNDDVERKTSWTGKVALAYPSDYGYATDFNSCSKTLFNYNTDVGCYGNNWMYDMSWPWMLTPYSSAASGAWWHHNDGLVYPAGVVQCAGEVYPVLYLNSELSIVSGDGSEINPYVVQ